MILNGLDFGSGHPYVMPATGQYVSPSPPVIASARVLAYSMAGAVDKMQVTFWAKAWQAIGGQSAGTIGALQYLLRQGEELAKNYDLNPAYIQWYASADPTAALNTASKQDGWWIVERFEPEYPKIVSGLVPVKLTVTKAATGSPQRQGVFYAGGALATNASGASQVAVGFPYNSSNQAASAVSRTGGEGAVPLSVGPAANLNPLPFTPSATVGDWFKGGCHVYDTINTGSNPVPIAGGTYIHTNWVEVFSTDHRFEGDCVVTNGLLLLIFITGQARALRGYLWNSALGTPTWQQFGDVTYTDNSSNTGTLRSYTLQRVGAEEVWIRTASSTSAGLWAEVGFRLQRGQVFSRMDFRPLSQANTNSMGLALVAANNLKAAYTSGAASDMSGGTVALAGLTNTTDYLYCAAFTNNSADPFVLGMLWRNEPNNSQGSLSGSTTIGIGDTTSPAQNAVNNYGIFAIPFANPQNFQAEVESVAPTAPAVNFADSAASGGHAIKWPSASNTSIATAFPSGTFTPLAGSHFLFIRAKVTAANSGTTQMRYGLYNAGYVYGPFNLVPNNLTTSYAFYLASTTAYVANGSTAIQFVYDSNGGATATTDFFLDEVLLVPVVSDAAAAFPQATWQQFMHDRTTKIVRY